MPQNRSSAMSSSPPKAIPPKTYEKGSRNAFSPPGRRDSARRSQQSFAALTLELAHTFKEQTNQRVTDGEEKGWCDS